MINQENPEVRKNIDDLAQMSDVWTYYFEGLKFTGKAKTRANIAIGCSVVSAILSVSAIVISLL